MHFTEYPSCRFVGPESEWEIRFEKNILDTMQLILYTEDMIFGIQICIGWLGEYGQVVDVLHLDQTVWV